MAFSRDAALTRNLPTSVSFPGNNPACLHHDVVKIHWDGVVTERCSDCSAMVEYWVKQ